MTEGMVFCSSINPQKYLGLPPFQYYYFNAPHLNFHSSVPSFLQKPTTFPLSSTTYFLGNVALVFVGGFVFEKLSSEICVDLSGGGITVE